MPLVEKNVVLWLGLAAQWLAQLDVGRIACVCRGVPCHWIFWWGAQVRSAVSVSCVMNEGLSVAVDRGAVPWFLGARGLSYPVAARKRSR